MGKRTQKRIFVAGGSGFIGREICRTAIGGGHEVVSLSRRGRPWLDEPWADQVAWLSGDALEPKGWRRMLDDCDAAVHSIGTLRERPTKGVTFERINGETAVTLAREAAKAGLDSFVFLSSKETPPLLSRRYLKAKRYAEQTITEEFGTLRSVFLRPQFVYGPLRPHATVLARLMEGALYVPGLRQGVEPRRPLHVSIVAAVVVYAATEADTEGVLTIGDIERLAEDEARSYLVPDLPKGKPYALAAGLAAATGVLAGYLLSRR